jgi:enoyl-CoA hydratase/carnithine racemase
MVSAAEREFRFLEFEAHGRTRILYLNAPPVNGINLEVVEELGRAISSLGRDRSEVRCLILTSRLTDVFSAGADLRMIRQYMEGPDLVGQMVHFNRRLQEVIQAVAALPFPVLAAINGHALGGGLELALACDFRFMSEGRGRLGLPEVRVGLLPGAGGTQRLSRLVGVTRAKDLIFTGNLLDPASALSIGLVDRVVPASSLLEESLRYASAFHSCAAEAVAVVKDCIRRGMDSSLEEGLALEMVGLEALLGTRDAREGVAAFLEKRPPVFTGS